MGKPLPISLPPGIQRDGTSLDANGYIDGQWVRFQRGKPKKIGGFTRITASLSSYTREMFINSRSLNNDIYHFNGDGIEMVTVDNRGLGAAIIDRTPSADFTANSDYHWSVAMMYDDAAGSDKSMILAVPTETLVYLDEATEYPMFYGGAEESTVFTKCADANAVAAGGIFVAQPYAVLYGKDGKVTWSNANEPRNFTTGDAGSDRVTAKKIVKGLPLASGSGTGGLLFSLDSVIRMDWVGGQVIFRFTTLSNSTSILAKNGVIEYDGAYYWIANDRFMVTNGSSIQELPNETNLNWFFDNVNRDYAQKIWSTKVPRYNEIWWFYPRGTATECSHAIVYNVKGKFWFDVELARSAGFYSQLFQYPVWAYNVSSYLHEYYWDSIEGETLSAIKSYFTTNNFGYITGGLYKNAQMVDSGWTRLTRIEPDFIQEGEMTLDVLHKEFPNSPEVTKNSYTFSSSDAKIDPRDQIRIGSLKFTSNVAGGHYEMGVPLLHIEPGDVRM